jgi:amino acid transporter
VDGPAAPAPDRQLKPSVGVLGGWAVAASGVAATTSIGIGMGSLASIVGNQLPILLVLAFLPMLGIAGAYARLNRVERNCVNGYVWVGMGPALGVLPHRSGHRRPDPGPADPGGRPCPLT